MEWFNTGEAPNCVNLARQTPATHQLVVRHADQVGVLAGVLDLLREASVNVQQMENVIYAGDGAAACARIQVVGSMTDEVIRSMNAQPNIFNVSMVELS